MFAVWHDTELGRHVRATVDTTEVGTDIIVEKAFASSSHEENLNKCCMFCQQLVESEAICSHCDYIFCTTCTNKMPEHERFECKCIFFLKTFSTKLGIDLGLSLLILRACIKGILEDPNTVDEQSRAILNQLHQQGTIFDLVRQLQTHIDDIDPEYAHLFRSIAPHILDQINNLFPNQTKITQQVIIDLFCVVLVNAHGICATGFTSDSGIGIFPIVSLLSHNCEPNCSFITQGDTIYVRNVKPILAGDEITISYVDLMQPTHIRRKELERTKFFTCHCARCESPSECKRYLRAYKCKNCDGYQVPFEQVTRVDETIDCDTFDMEENFDDAFDAFDRIYGEKEEVVTIWRCEKCEQEFDWIPLERHLDSIIQTATKLRLENKYKEAVDLLWTEYQQNSDTHENHFQVFNVLVQIVLTLDQEPSALSVSDQKHILKTLCKISESVLPPHHFETAQYQERLAKLYND